MTRRTLGPALLAACAIAHAAPLPLGEEDVARSAIAGSPDLTVARENERIGRLEEIRQRAILWAPTLSLDTSWRQGSRPTPLYFQALSGVIDETALDAKLSLKGRTSIGTSYELSADGRRDTTTAYNDFSPMSPLYQSSLQLSLVQPLLRGATPGENNALVIQAKHDTAAAALETRRQAEQIVSDAVERYLVWAGKVQEVEIRRQSLALSEELRKAIAGRISHGAGAALDIAQADSSVAARETEVVEAQRDARDAETALLRVAYLQYQPGFTWSSEIVPRGPLAEPPPSDLQMLDHLDDDIRNALDRRPEVKRQRELIAAQEAIVYAARRGRLWRLDLRAQVGVLGLAGSTNPVGDAPADSVGPPPVGPLFQPNAQLFGNFGTAFANGFTMGTLYYLVGLTLDIPLSNRQHEAEAEQAERELAKRRAELSRIEADVAVTVRGLVFRAKDDLQNVQLGRDAVRFAEVNLDAEQRKFKGGVSTTFDVLRVQAEVASARLVYLKALAQLDAALVELARETGTLLDRYRIAVR